MTTELLIKATTLIAYFSTNGYITGNFFASVSSSDFKENKLYYIFQFIVGIFLGSIVYATLWIALQFTNLYRYLKIQLQLDFWFKFYFTKKLDNMKSEDFDKLVEINSNTARYWSSDSFRDKMIQKALRVLNNKVQAEFIKQ